MNCVVRQKKNLKVKEAQEKTNTSESSKASDSGYSGMDSREDPKTSDSARSKATGNDKSRQRRNGRDVNSNDQVVKQDGQFAAGNKVPSYEERRAKEVNKNLKRKPEDDSRAESSDRQVRVINICGVWV